MYIIAGLGNPTDRYTGTRHNVGFAVIDALAEKYNIPVNAKKCAALVGTGLIEGEKVMLAKPQTYMNRSGESIRPLADYYRIDVERELIVIYDDLDLGVGEIRVREKGSAGGHNGMKSILANLESNVFLRVRVGTGPKPENFDMVNFVLSHFPAEDADGIKEGIKKAVDAVKLILTDGVSTAMNTYNRKAKPKEE